MINESLQFLATEINNYLNNKVPSVDINVARLVVSNISLAAENLPADTISPEMKGKAVLSLVNVEEDRISKQQENYIKSDIKTIYKNPPVYINLYVLFAMNRKSYDESLSILGFIIQFFQQQHVFTPSTHPALDNRIQQLVVDLYSLSFEQSNHLWSILGGKYMPCVMYKIRQLTVDENKVISQSGFIKEIQLNDKLKQPLS